jgi:hypothetical protein
MKNSMPIARRMLLTALLPLPVFAVTAIACKINPARLCWNYFSFKERN